MSGFGFECRQAVAVEQLPEIFSRPCQLAQYPSELRRRARTQASLKLHTVTRGVLSDPIENALFVTAFAFLSLLFLQQIGLRKTYDLANQIVFDVAHSSIQTEKPYKDRKSITIFLPCQILIFRAKQGNIIQIFEKEWTLRLILQMVPLYALFYPIFDGVSKQNW